MTIEQAVACLTRLNNLTNTFRDDQMAQLAQVLEEKFGEFTSVQCEHACMQTLHMEGKITAQLVVRAHDKLRDTIKQFGLEEKQKATMARYAKEYDERGMTPEEFITSGTKVKVDKLMADLAAKKTAWRKDSVTTPGLTHDDVYALRRDEFVFTYADRMGGMFKAREAWNKAVPISRWRESEDTTWVDVEIGKLVL